MDKANYVGHAQLIENLGKATAVRKLNYHKVNIEVTLLGFQNVFQFLWCQGHLPNFFVLHDHFDLVILRAKHVRT